MHASKNERSNLSDTLPSHGKQGHGQKMLSGFGIPKLLSQKDKPQSLPAPLLVDFQRQYKALMCDSERPESAAHVAFVASSFNFHRATKVAVLLPCSKGITIEDPPFDTAVL
jgi:hypothetical protein